MRPSCAQLSTEHQDGKRSTKLLNQFPLYSSCSVFEHHCVEDLMQIRAATMFQETITMLEAPLAWNKTPGASLYELPERVNKARTSQRVKPQT